MKGRILAALLGFALGMGLVASGVLAQAAALEGLGFVAIGLVAIGAGYLLAGIEGAALCFGGAFVGASATLLLRLLFP